MGAQLKCFNAERGGCGARPSAADVGAAPASHVTDAVKHITAEERTAWNGKAAKPTALTITLPAAGWTGTAAPYSQTVNVTGLTAGGNGDIGLAQTATAAQRAAARDAMLCVTGQAAGALTTTADGDKPTVNIPVIVTILG